METIGGSNFLPSLCSQAKEKTDLHGQLRNNMRSTLTELGRLPRE